MATPNSQVEEFTATIDTTGLSENTHTIYIQATDQNGPGVVSAIFLKIDNSAGVPVTEFFDDFETDQGWTTNPSNTDTATTGHWARANPQATTANDGGAQQLGTTVSGDFDLVTGPLAGSGLGSHDIDNGVTSIISPLIPLPDSSSITLSFYSYLAHLNNATSDDIFRATVSDGITTTVVYEDLGESSQINGSWQKQTADITAYSGQTITILFEAADAAGGSLVEAAVDDVEIIAVLENQPPDVTNPGDQQDEEGTDPGLQIIASDPDTPLVYSASELPDGLAINSSSGLISGTISATPPAVFESSVTVTDSENNQTTVEFMWTITVQNTAPVVTNPGPQNSDEGINIVPLAIDADDDDGDQLFYSATGLPPGLDIDMNSGVISGSLDFNSADSYNTKVDVTDTLATSSVEFSWTVNNVNRPPVFNQTIPDQTNIEGDSVNIAVDASDPDGDDLEYFATGLPAGVSINIDSGIINGTLNAGSATTYIVDVTVQDDGGLSVMQTFTLQVNPNLPPTVTNPGIQTDDRNVPTSLQIQADDPENVSLTYSDIGNSLPTGLGIDTNSGLISGSITAAVGSYTVTIEVSDGPNQVEIMFNWTVNQGSNTEQTIYVSSTTGGNVGGIGFSDEDIMTYNRSTDTWSKYIDGSDVGLSGSGARDINALTVMNDGSVIFSVLGATTIPDVGAIDDSDLIRFIPISLGATTAGTFELYFDGSDVGLSTNGEDIDSVYLLANGNLLISTIGSHNVPGDIIGQDEDLLLFTPTNLGASTTGTWSRYFDGSDVGLHNSSTEDVYATWLDESNGDIYLSTRVDFSVTGVSGINSDIFVCSPTSIGANTSCEFSMFWSGALFGFGTENIDGLFIE